MRRTDLPPLDALPAFELAARHLSFTRAAEELFLTQSAISKQIGSLEAALGQPLFERRTRALALTPAGERLLRATETALAGLREAVAEMRAGDEPMMTLAATPAVASFWLIPRLSDFRRSNPGIDIRISADTRVVDLERGRFDAAIRYLPDAQAPAGALRLTGGTVLAVCSPSLLGKSGHPLASPADLAHHVLLNYEDDERRHPWLSWPAWLEAAGMADLRPAGSISFNHYESVLRAAIEAQGVALAAQGLVEQLLQAGTLVAPLPQQYSIPRSYYFVVTARGGDNPAVVAFQRWIAGLQGDATMK